MTRRTVVWVSDAEAELAEIWLASESRNRVTSASHEIDQALSQNAELVGSPLVEGLRAFDAPPLRVLFEILDMDRTVRVLKVKQIARS
jgi:plasmid stabilization system protein ParE